MASASAPPAALSAEQAKVVLAEVIQAFSAPENAVRMDEARDNACNDMGKMLQFVLPVATQIQQEVIKAYGFSCDGEGGSDEGWRGVGPREGAGSLGP
uniref:Protein C10 n=1 Tax=Neovison vison TaxID=452646 RepID=A0A8C7C5H9_NEOVI